eukprot:TRINITY_DN47091_c0_g1_i1.p1 TRINITY_DN47091_c0_g1~~TRINITY_DN47091_c0_g1_i1.p1  ORF type:complete len:670 (+),score=153.30 TRINITY_DN47091_c0_g1_i1:133-2142(+)
MATARLKAARGLGAAMRNPAQRGDGWHVFAYSVGMPWRGVPEAAAKFAHEATMSSGGQVSRRWASSGSGGAAESSWPMGSSSARGVPEILFEDLEPATEDTSPGGGASSSSRGKSSRSRDAGPAAFPFAEGGSMPGDSEDIFGGKQRGEGLAERAPAPFGDAELAAIDPRTLPRFQLIWAIGRAATIGLRSHDLWKNFGEALEAVGEADLTPSELCRVMQAFGYAPADVPLDPEQLQRLTKAFARRIRRYSDEHMMRVIYGYCKLASKRNLRKESEKFLDFASSEVVARGKKLLSWRKINILQALWTLPTADDMFKKVVVGQVMQHVQSLDSARLASFVPMLVDAGFIERPGVVEKLNRCLMRKQLAFRSPQLTLQAGLPLFLHDLMKTSTMATWLERLYELQAPPLVPRPPPVDDLDGVVERWKKERTRVRQAGGRRRLDGRLPSGAARNGVVDPEEMPLEEPWKHQDDDDELDRSKRRRWKVYSSTWTPDALAVLDKSGRCAGTECLQGLKVVELTLRHERPSVLAVLPAKALRILEEARATPLEPPEHHKMLELPFVFNELARGFRKIGLLLHPTIEGPYLLELADPLGRVVVEWDANWLLYPPWRRREHELFVRRKHLHLRAEGWKVICLPLQEFQALETPEAKVEFLQRVVEKEDLGYLQASST